MQEYFHLTKDAFDIDPFRDADAYFGYQPLQDKIMQRLAADFVQQRHVPKFFLFGRYGSGKTHTLSHIRHALKNDAEFVGVFQPTEPIYTEVPPLKGRETWHKMHEHLLDAIGKSLIKDAIKALMAEASMADPGAAGDVPAALEAREVLRFGDASLRTSQASIFRAMLFGGNQEVVAWEWLKGKPLSTDQATTLGTETNLTEPSDYVNALLNVASLIHKGLGRKVVILLDEAEMFRSVTHADSHQEFLWAVRRLMENENDVLGLIAGFQQEGGMGDAPEVFTDDSVKTRVGDDGYIDLGDLVQEEVDVKAFMASVLDRLVDQDAARVTIANEGLPTEPEFFPFTEEVVDRIAEFIIEDPERQSPRNIKSLLASAVVRTWQEGANTSSTLLCDTDLVEKVLYPNDLSL
ncbi:hypothetical protein GCM10027053_48040 [Intrasporangium mesophilum]